jgi:hypothetical protein
VETGGLGISAGWTAKQKEEKVTIRTRTGDEADTRGRRTPGAGHWVIPVRRTGISARRDAGCVGK